ncbi:unnamed protein product, partial [marine sediment metagenome]
KAMGLKTEVDKIFLERLLVVTRPSQTYLTAAPGPAHILFNISGGAVEITDLGAVVTGAVVGAPTIDCTINGIAVDDDSAPACNGAIGTVIWVPLDPQGTIVNALAIPKVVTTAAKCDTRCTSVIAGIQPATVGTIVANLTTATSLTLQWFVVYRRLSPNSNIAVA